ATVVFDQAGSGTYAGVMSGSGSLTKNNAGTLILTGSNTYSGGTAVNGGTLQGNTTSLQGDIVNNAAVVFDQSTDGTYAAAMSGSGALTKLGAGSLTIGGVNTFSGPTAVDAGTLTVLGSMTSSIALAPGTTLTGNGTVGGISAAAGSIIAPGNAQSTLTVNGTYAHSDGAVFRVHADAGGAASRLNVNGAATLAGGTVDVLAEDGNYAPSTRYTILNASTGLGGAFSSVTSNLAFLTPTLEYDPTNVFLRLARNDINFAAVALTPNQRQVSNALDQATAANATGDMATVIDAVTALSAPQARSAYESMGGLIHTLLPTIGISDAIQFSRATASRLRARSDGTTGTGLAWSGIKLASAPATKSDAPALFASSGATRTGSEPVSGKVWLSGYGLDGDLEGDASSGAYDYRIHGLIIGVDTDVDRHWTGGLSAAFSDWRVRNDGRGDRSDAQAYRIAAYGRFTDGPIRVDGVVGFGNVNYETDRRIVFGTINRTAHADYSGDQFTANVVGHYRVEQGSYGIEPFAALQYILESQRDFVEAGADSINLAVASRKLKSTRGTLGARVDRAFETAGGKGRVEVRAGYSREFSGVPHINATFVGDPVRTSLGIFAENFDRESWLAGAGMSFSPRKNLTLYADVNGDFQSRGTLVSVMGGLRLAW
ncbi:MAG: autotransporter domain-containing protein, partial [Burkholderiaceae bacterium]